MTDRAVGGNFGCPSVLTEVPNVEIAVRSVLATQLTHSAGEGLSDDVE